MARSWQQYFEFKNSFHHDYANSQRLSEVETSTGRLHIQLVAGQQVWVDSGQAQPPYDLYGMSKLMILPLLLWEIILIALVLIGYKD